MPGSVPGLVLGLLCAGLLVSCGPPAEIETPPPPGTDPAKAFPQYDAVYRNAGSLGGKESTVAHLLHVRYLRFFPDGTVRCNTESTGSDRQVRKRMSREAFEALALDSGHKYALQGKYVLSGSRITISLSRSFTYQGRAGMTRVAFEGDVDGDQLKLTRKDPDTGKRMSPEIIYWPADQ